jgi:hypothetical protein
VTTSTRPLSQKLADAVRQQALTAGAESQRLGMQTATVTAVNGDGTVNIGVIVARRMDTYNSPLVGDRVYLVEYAGGFAALGRVVPTTGDGWTALPLLGTWVANGGGSDPVPAVRITTDGELQLSGMVKGTAVAAGANANLGTVPAGLLPTWWITGVAGTSNAQGFARIRIDPSTGTVSLTNGSVALTTTSWVALDGIRGRAR